MVTQFEKMKSGIRKIWIDINIKKNWKTDVKSVSGGSGAAPLEVPALPLWRGGRRRKTHFFLEKIRVIVGDILVNFKNLA